MKCELCHKADAQTAITRWVGDEEQELYVCRACAEKERKDRQKKSQRTRKDAGMPPGLSITVSEGSGEPPPFISAIMNAMNGLVSDLEQASKKQEPKPTPKSHEFPMQRIDGNYRYAGMLHLEGLHLIGELEATIRAVRALRMELVGTDSDGLRSVGHAYTLRYDGSSEQAKRVVEDILTQERNARVRLFEETPRVFGDSLCRALAILKNCRLLSPGELFDLISPLRLAAIENMLDGITLKDLESMAEEIDLSGYEDTMDQSQRDMQDSARADKINERFHDVMLNERAEEKFL